MRRADEQASSGRIGDQRALDPRAGRRERIEQHVGVAFGLVIGMTTFQDAKVARDQASLLPAKGPRSQVRREDRGRADIAETGFANAQREIRVFEIAVVVFVGQGADSVEAGAGEEQAKADAGRRVDGEIGVDRARDVVEARPVGAKGVGDERLGETDEFPVVAQRVDRADARVEAGDAAETDQSVGRDQSICVQQQNIAIRNERQRAIDRPDIAAVAAVRQETGPGPPRELTQIFGNGGIGRGVVDDQRVGVARKPSSFWA